jgi:hypothetical protein
MAAKHCSGPTEDLKMEFHNQFAVNVQIRTQVQRSRDASVGIATRLRDARRRFDSKQGQNIFLYATAFRWALGPTQPPFKWVSGACFPGVKRPVT